MTLAITSRGRSAGSVNGTECTRFHCGRDVLPDHGKLIAQTTSTHHTHKRTPRPRVINAVALQLPYRRFGTSGPAELVVSPGAHVTHKRGAKTRETFAAGMPHAAIDDAISSAVENRASEAL